MVLSAIALSAALSGQAHWVNWEPSLIQMGVSVGEHSDERLILMVTPDGCAAGMKIYSGRNGDFEKATELLSTSDVCSEVDRRRLIR